MPPDMFGFPSMHGQVPVGVVLPWAGSVETRVPRGWLLCRGQTVPIASYPALHAVMGTAFDVAGGLFTIPDMRGRFPLGKDNMGGTSANRVTNAAADTVGLSAGAETHNHPTNIGQSGGTSADPNSLANHMPPYLTLLYIIKT